MNTLLNRRILLVDDTPAIHGDFRKILADTVNGTALDEDEAALFGAPTRAKPVCFETIERLWQEDPALQIVLCTAYSDYSWAEVLARLDVRDRLLILKKPFDAVAVYQLASTLTMKWEMTRQAALKMSGLEQLLAERNSLLDSALENVSQGVTVFDASGRLLLINGQYRDMYGLSADTAIPSITMRDVLAQRLAAGTFNGDPNQYAAKFIGGEWKAAREAKLADGRIILVDVKPKPGGGW